ncbi:hypothetical protein LUU34_01520600 [Aix galericulata]|nr:hypothetical protein LUU34_01520600 [Aix galericulata]
MGHKALGPAGQQLPGVDRTGCGQQPPHTPCTASAPALKACPLHPMSRIYKCRPHPPAPPGAPPPMGGLQRGDLLHAARTGRLG